MINKDLYDKTVSILVDAYFNDTLMHCTCSACAVGNIVSANTGREIYYDANGSTPSTNWGNVFCTNYGSDQLIFPENYIGEAKVQIDSTGYTWQELAKIEYAFETAPKGNTDEDWMFNGLLAVIDALDIIHENTDTELTTTSKARFNKSLV